MKKTNAKKDDQRHWNDRMKEKIKCNTFGNLNIPQDKRNLKRIKKSKMIQILWTFHTTYV
jgi:hypothetical protein